MGIFFSSIGTVGGERLITSGSNGEPNWSYIPSKGKSTKTQTEFVSEIKELAQKAANAGEIFGPDGNEQRDQYGSSCGLQYVAGNQSDLLDR